MTGQNIITGIDHPVIAIRDMAAAHAAYARLGFTIPPRGSHLEWGTGNWCILFPDDYLELRGIIDPQKYTHHLDSFLKTREGLMGVALSTNDAVASHDALVGASFIRNRYASSHAISSCRRELFSLGSLSVFKTWRRRLG